MTRERLLWLCGGGGAGTLAGGDADLFFAEVRRLGGKAAARRRGAPRSRGSPSPAATAAATAPSTSGAAVRSTLAAPPLVEQVERQLGGEDGAAQVHEDQHAVLRPQVVDRREHLGGVGAEGAVGLVQPAGGADPHLRPGHLGGQLHDALGEPGSCG